MGLILDTALHQVRALGLSVASCLDTIIGSTGVTPQNPVDVVDWLKEEGFSWNWDMPEPDEWIIWRPMQDHLASKLRAGVPETALKKVLLITFSPEFDHPGAKRSGAGVLMNENYIITSGFVRLLGAHEQFQMDVQKALLFHRPGGLLGHESEHILEDVSPDVVNEKPEDGSNTFFKPPLWTWVKGHAENNVERAKILDRVFAIKQFKPKTMGLQNWEAWYEMRNCIAHGRKGVEVSLKVYCEAELLVVSSMLDTAEQCETKLKLRV